ncbi:MAG: flippase [Roseivirga sp.]
MIKSIYKKLYSDSAWSLYGQATFLMANFALFLILIKTVDSASFGIWALYVTVISITDSLRQGLLQNGLTRALIQKPAAKRSLIASGLLINYSYILIIGLVLILTSLIKSTEDLSLFNLLPHAIKTLLGLGTLQFMNILYFSRTQFRDYFISNLLYLISFGIGLLLLTRYGQLSFIAVINLQCLATVPSVVYYLIKNKVKWSLPLMTDVKELLSFGKYIAGTNLLSMLFHKADVLMLAVLVDPVAVALFHFATKIVGYAEIPLNALSQVIYPRLAVSHQQKGTTELKRTYVSSIVNLLLMATPIIIAVIMFIKEIISLLSTDTYASSAPLIIILCITGLFKPFGRVFGLTLDAMGKPGINFQMLCLSLVVNVFMNLILIPLYGVQGAALATCSSIIITVVWGQIRIKKYIDLDHRDILREFIQLTSKYKHLKLKTQ